MLDTAESLGVQRALVKEVTHADPQIPVIHPTEARWSWGMKRLLSGSPPPPPQKASEGLSVLTLL